MAVLNAYIDSALAAYRPVAVERSEAHLPCK